MGPSLQSIEIGNDYSSVIQIDALHPGDGLQVYYKAAGDLKAKLKQTLRREEEY
jgi:hypothetical protein